MSEMRFIERGSEEWERMWSLVDDGKPMLDDGTGEVWQYMGTVKRLDEWMHEFRHRHHPVHKERTCKLIPASAI
jgi:hypothetical protein